MGWRLDDPGAAIALPAMGHLGPRFRARDIAGKIALVYAVALRPMARHEFDAVGPQSMIPKKPVPDLIRDGHRFSDKIMLKSQKKVLPNRTRQGACARRVRSRLPAFVGSE